jgi:ADP-heptose:LPS heptosyltransferase
MHLGQFASLIMADRILPEKHLQYVPLAPVDVSHFNIDFKNTVVLVTSYRDVTRMWYAEYILEVAKWLQSKGLTPLFIGKTNMEQNVREAVIPKTSLPNDISEYGIDLRNKTTIPELASIFRQTRAICGLDSGPIHLAGTTDVPIICGYTSISPENRVPYRLQGKTYPIAPDIECIGCESRWRSNLWNYENCYHKHADCCKEMTADKFINILQSII